ncbi:MAG: protein kinase [Elusimicrobiaceae bacterium]|nr:protein kinase [Elusimicrobiaceae bacterium]
MRITKIFILFTLLTLPLFAQNNAIIVEGPYGSAQKQLSLQEEAKKITDLNRKIEELNQAVKAEDYAFVQEETKKLIAQDVKDSRVERLLALSYEKQSDCKNAIYYATQAIARQPSDAQAYAVRASCYYKNGDTLRATEDIETALNLNPNYLFAQDLKNLIDNYDTQIVKKKYQARNQKRLPSWFVPYLICVLALIGFLLILHFKAIYSLKDKKGTAYQGINIKEKYNFIRQIGEGGMGKVYEAYDNVLKRRVAVKRIRPELLKNDYIREQFLSEARMVAMLRNPYIVEIYTVIETANSLYLVFEYVDGQTLETRLDIDNNLTLEQAKDIFSSVCKGLAYAHKQDVVHCDLKPGNIMIADSGIAKVMDFGVAKKLAGGSKKEAKNLAGTPAYMSPEQQQGIMSKQSDIYSLAVCLYETLCGQVPWSVDGFDVETKKIVPLSKLLPDIPPAVDALIERCLKEDPVERVQSVEEFWERLSKA